jgi:branched-chain amino acid transport system substrate-binding protein
MERTRISKRFASITAVLVAMMLALALSGCGSKPAASGGGAAAVTVKIGVGAPLTQGVVAFGQGIDRATKLAAEEANASERAKKLGIKFVVVAGDDQGDPKTGVTVANQFASDPALVGVVGHVNSGVAIPASTIYNRAQIVMIAPSATDPKLTQQGLKSIFRVCTIDTVQGSFAADAAAKDLGFKKAFVVDDSSQYGSGLADFFSQQFKADGGTLAGREKTSDKDTDFKALVVRIAASKPDVVYYGGLYNAGALLAKQLRDAGVDAPVFGGDGLNDGEFVKLAGAKNAEGSFATAIGLPLDKLPQGAAFKAAYAKAYPSETISAYDPYGYDAANVIINAVLTAAEKVGAGTVTSAQGRDAIIAAVAATDSEGVTGKLAFDGKGDTLNKAITLYTVRDGAWTAWSK